MWTSSKRGLLGDRLWGPSGMVPALFGCVDSDSSRSSFTLYVIVRLPSQFESGSVCGLCGLCDCVWMVSLLCSAWVTSTRWGCVSMGDCVGLISLCHVGQCAVLTTSVCGAERSLFTLPPFSRAGPCVVLSPGLCAVCLCPLGVRLHVAGR